MAVFEMLDLVQMGRPLRAGMLQEGLLLTGWMNGQTQL